MPAGEDDPGYDAGEATHRALRAIRRELERHPAVAVARGFPERSFSRVEAEVDPVSLDVDVSEATLTVRWFDGVKPTDPPEFAFHYSDDTGLELGWHHEPNPHVEGPGHFQRRSAAADAYEYEPYEFATAVPARVVWEVLGALEEFPHSHVVSGSIHTRVAATDRLNSYWSSERSMEYPRSLARMTFQDRLRSLEERYGLDESERAREIGRTVAHLRD